MTARFVLTDGPMRPATQRRNLGTRLLCTGLVLALFRVTFACAVTQPDADDSDERAGDGGADGAGRGSGGVNGGRAGNPPRAGRGGNGGAASGGEAGNGMGNAPGDGGSCGDACGGVSSGGEGHGGELTGEAGQAGDGSSIGGTSGAGMGGAAAGSAGISAGASGAGAGGNAGASAGGAPLAGAGMGGSLSGSGGSGTAGAGSGGRAAPEEWETTSVSTDRVPSARQISEGLALRRVTAAIPQEARGLPARRTASVTGQRAGTPSSDAGIGSASIRATAARRRFAAARAVAARRPVGLVGTAVRAVPASRATTPFVASRARVQAKPATANPSAQVSRIAAAAAARRRRTRAPKGL
jgi:hypothetical protein